MNRSRTFNIVATLLTLFIVGVVAALPAQASPVAYHDVVQVFGNLQRGGQFPELRLVNVQSGRTPVTSGTAAQGASAQSIASTADAPAQGAQQPNIEVIQEGDITGTVCDCGEIIIPGGWPKWPLLAGIPFICFTGICTHDNPPCQNQPCTTPTPPTTPEVPEPTSLLLLSTGLAVFGAGARRRHMRTKLAKEVATHAEV